MSSGQEKKKRGREDGDKEEVNEAGSQNPPVKKKKKVEEAGDERIFDLLNEEYQTKEFQKEEKERMAARKPFPFCSISNFIDPSLLTQVKEELQELTFFVKGNDLYDFLQSDDLKNIHSPGVSKLKKFFDSEEMLQWMREITGIEGLKRGTVNLFSAVYGDTAKLLCHDDRLEGRRVAFILYLSSPDWSEADGGHLDLFSSDEKTRQPLQVATSLLPQWNTFNFFNVGELSHHQVREVLSKSGRTSIGGWYHGPPIKYLPKQINFDPQFKRTYPPPESEDSLLDLTTEHVSELNKWVSPTYLKTDNIRGINEKIMDDGSIILQNFLCPSLFKSIFNEFLSLENLKKASHQGAKKRPKTIRQKKNEGVSQPSLPLSDTHVHWKPIGPANLRHYYRFVDEEISEEEGKEEGKKGKEEEEEEDSSSPVKHIPKLIQFLKSEAFLFYVRACCGLDVVSCEGEIRRFAHGCYSLMSDHDPDSGRESLDVSMTFVGNEEWNEDDGGWTSYVAKDDEDGELLTVTPIPNSLSIVFRDTGCLRFVKYVNHNAPGPVYDALLSYHE